MRRRHEKKVGESKPKKGQNRIKTGQKQEAWQNREKSEAVTVDRGRKIEENAKRRVKFANSYKDFSKDDVLPSLDIKDKEKLLQQEQWAYLSTRPSKRLPSFCYDDDDEDYTSAITPNEPVLSTEEPDNSLSTGDEHLDTIPATESDEFIKSGVETLILIPSESEGIPDHMCDVTFLDNSPPFDVSKDQIEDFFESNEEFSSTDDDSFSFDDIDYVEASPLDYELVSSEVMEIVISKVGGIEASNDNPVPFYDPIISGTPPNLTPSGEKFVSANSDAKIKSFSLYHILVKDSDSLMEEIDLFCTPDYPMPPGIEDKDYDSERDILIPKDLPSNNFLSFAKKESFHFDIPPFSRPPAKPPDGDTGILNIKMMGNISDQNAFMNKLMITLAPHQEKSPDLLSHRCGTVKKFNTHRSHLNKCPMMIHGQNNPPLDVLLFHFYPP
nr:hypothetical protein [Tanacetum cinerariifolium]